MDDIDGLPRLLLIGDAFTKAVHQNAVKEAVEAGVKWVQLRDHDAEEEALQDTAAGFVRELQSIRPDVCISINTHVEIARHLNAHLHVGSRGPDVLNARASADRWLGYSAHSLRDGVIARRHGADYITFSPVYRTKSKPRTRPKGTDTLGQMCSAVEGFPVMALGGISVGRVEDCLNAGAHGVAVLSGILYHENPGAASRAYLSALSKINKSDT